MLVPRQTADVKVRGDFADEEDVSSQRPMWPCMLWIHP